MAKKKKATIDDQELRRSIYDQARAELLARQLSNATSFDKAILSLSSTILGVSLAFIKDVVKIQSAKCALLLYLSWWLLAIAIISTVSSYIAGQRAIDRQLDHIEKYYIDRDDSYFNKTNIPAIVTGILNTISGIAFIIAMISTIIFVSMNIGG